MTFHSPFFVHRDPILVATRIPEMELLLAVYLDPKLLEPAE